MAIKKGGTVDMAGLSTTISRSKSFKRVASLEAIKAAKREARLLMAEFSSHKVTQEIEAGPKSENISGTLGGVGTSGNLYTFIGFDEMSSPTRPVKTILESSMFITSVRAQMSGSKRSALVAVNISVPSLNKIKEVTPMPWEPGKSWLMGIEEGISGFGHYLYKKFEKGRSKFGLQSKYKVRNSSFRTVPYFPSMYEKFLSRLRRL